MFDFKHLFIGTMIAVVALVLQAGQGSVRAADTTDVFELLSEALLSADEMVQSAQEDQPDLFLTQAADFSDRIKEAMGLVSPETDAGDVVRGHLQMALSEAVKAVDNAHSGQMDEAVNDALNALSHAEEANSLAETLR